MAHCSGSLAIPTFCLGTRAPGPFFSDFDLSEVGEPDWTEHLVRHGLRETRLVELLNRCVSRLGGFIGLEQPPILRFEVLDAVNEH